MAKYHHLSKDHVSKWPDMCHGIIKNNVLKPNYYYINFISWGGRNLMYFVDNDTDYIH